MTLLSIICLFLTVACGACGNGDFMPPPAPSKHFVWEKDKNGKDHLVFPN